MQILTRCNCDRCTGQGIIYNHNWHEFDDIDAKFKEEHGRNMNTKECETWFREHGYSRVPDEEIQCPDCRGYGVIEQWREAKDVLNYLQQSAAV